MSCASCSSRVENMLNGLFGVDYASVNLNTELAKIKFDAKYTSPEIIKEEIEKIGYTSQEYRVGDTLNDDMKVRVMFIKLMLSLIFSIPLFCVTVVPMATGIVLPEAISPQDNALRYALIQAILTIPIIAIGCDFYFSGFKALISLHPNMNSLIAISTSVAFLYSIFNLFKIIFGDLSAVNYLYFDSVGMIITLILLGRYLEIKTKKKTNQSIIKLIDLAPQKAVILKNGQEFEIDANMINRADIVIVKSGWKIPVDGIVIEGTGLVNEAMLTGESMPAEKLKGSKVFAASINNSGYLKIKALKVGKETNYSKIVEIVQNAQSTKPNISRIADRVSAVFVPIVCLIAIASAVIWFVTNYDIDFALRVFTSVLVVACPCALGLATPTAIVVATGIGAEEGILIKNGEALELAGKVDTVMIDKTGTMTEGYPQVTDMLVNNKISVKKFLCLCASMEIKTDHPISKAIIDVARTKKAYKLKITEFEQIPGYGLKGVFNKKKVLMGNLKFMDENDVFVGNARNSGEDFSKQGKTVIYVSWGRLFLGFIAVADKIKTDCADAVEALNEMKVEVMMLTGDNTNTANAIAKQVGIQKIIAEVLPDRKALEVDAIKKSDRVVAMVGDGINDAPALVKADVGISVANGTDIATESSDIVLTSNRVLDLVNALRLGEATLRNIKQNLFWAFLYNSISIPIAAGALYALGGPMINPVISAVAMSFSSISVLLNTLRLKHFKFYRYSEDEADTKESEESDMKKYVITVPNMACDHCKNVISGILDTLGAENVKIDLQSKKIEFFFSDNALYKKAVDKIKEANYNVVEEEE